MGQNAELVAIRVGHHDPADHSLPDVDPLRAKRDRRSTSAWLITACSRREVEVLPALRRSWDQGAVHSR